VIKSFSISSDVTGDRREILQDFYAPKRYLG
jgi:hypothetical protein